MRNITINKRHYIYLFCLISVFVFSLNDYFNNKRLVRYTVILNFENEIGEFAELKNNILSNLTPEIYLDNTFVEKNHYLRLTSTIQNLAFIKNYISSDEFKNYFIKFLENKRFSNDKKEKIVNDIYSGIQINFFVTLESGLLKNEIIFKTFFPEIADEYINLLKKRILNEANKRIENISKKQLDYALKLAKDNIQNKISSIINLIKINKEAEYLNNILPPIIILTEDSSFSDTELYQYAIFIDSNKKLISNTIKMDITESFVDQYFLFKLYEKKVSNSNFNFKNNLIIIKESDTRHYNIYEAWSKLITLLFIFITFELIILKKLFKYFKKIN